MKKAAEILFWTCAILYAGVILVGVGCRKNAVSDIAQAVKICDHDFEWVATRSDIFGDGKTDRVGWKCKQCGMMVSGKFPSKKFRVSFVLNKKIVAESKSLKSGASAAMQFKPISVNDEDTVYFLAGAVHEVTAPTKIHETGTIDKVYMQIEQ